MMKEPISHVQLELLGDNVGIFFGVTTPRARVGTRSTTGSWELYNQPAVLPNFALMLIVVTQVEVSPNSWVVRRCGVCETVWEESVGMQGELKAHRIHLWVSTRGKLKWLDF